MFPSGSDWALAQSTISGLEPGRALEAFKGDLMELTHCLRFFQSFLYSPAKKPHISVDLAGDVYSGQNMFVRLIPEGGFTIT